MAQTNSAWDAYVMDMAAYGQNRHLRDIDDLCKVPKRRLFVCLA